MERRINGRADDDWCFDDEMLTKDELLRIASEIISELPESQRRFFKDLYGTSRSQYKVAQIYGISPQAVTNRIKKLTKTVEKKIIERTGYSPEQITEILGEKSMEQMLEDKVDAALKYSRHDTIKVNGVYKERRLDAETMQMVKESMQIYKR